MEYKKVNFSLEPDNEINREILIAELGNIGFDSFTESNETVEAYIPSAYFSEDLFKNDFLSDFPFITFKYLTETIPDQNWNEIWEKNYFEPLLIENQCLIRAPFHEDYPKAQFEIVIEPKMAFGTGNHETTYLMVSYILETELEGKTILDMGCGTGILGLLSSMKGADKVTALDIDESAYHATIENAKNNHVSNIVIKLGGAELLGEERYDIILANIHRNILLKDLPLYTHSLNPRGTIIMSGFYLADLHSIQQKAEDLGLKLSGFKEKNTWIATKFILK